SHRDQEYRQRQHRPDPESPRHVAQFGVLVIGPPGYCVFRFESHATFRATPRMILLDLRMHRARVAGRGRRLPCRIALQRHAAFWTSARLVALRSRTHHWAEIFLRRFALHRSAHGLISSMTMMIMPRTFSCTVCFGRNERAGISLKLPL